MAQDLVDAMPIGIANEQAPRLSPNLAEALATFADGWGIYQWQHVFHVTKQKGIEQRFVCILQIAKKGIFVEGSGLLRQGRAPALHLVFEVPDVRRQQTVQVKQVAFVFGKCSALIEARRVDQIVSGKRHRQGLSSAGQSWLLAHFRPFRARVARDQPTRSDLQSSRKATGKEESSPKNARRFNTVAGINIVSSVRFQVRRQSPLSEYWAMHTARSNGGRLAGRLITYQLNRKEATTGRRRPPARGEQVRAARRELAPPESCASLETRNRETADRL